VWLKVWLRGCWFVDVFFVGSVVWFCTYLLALRRIRSLVVHSVQVFVSQVVAEKGLRSMYITTH
jgi:hypothetical protein